MITKDWLQAQLIAYSLMQSGTATDLSGRFADVIMAEIKAKQSDGKKDEKEY